MRLEPIAPADLSDQQRPLYDRMKKGVGDKFTGFITMRADDALLGPWNAWLHDPELGAVFWSETQALTRAQRIPDTVRQVAILTVGAHFRAAYELYAHGSVARQKHGMSERKLTTLAAGERPEDLTDDEATAFDVARALLRGGPLADQLYRRSLEAFEQAGTNELIFLVGHYCLVSMTLNGFAVPVPETP